MRIRVASAVVDRLIDIAIRASNAAIRERPHLTFGAVDLHDVVVVSVLSVVDGIGSSDRASPENALSRSANDCKRELNE